MNAVIMTVTMAIKAVTPVSMAEAMVIMRVTAVATALTRSP